MNVAAEPIDLVVLDLGRVLIRICDSWQQVCSLVGVPCPRGMVDGSLTPLLEHFGRLHETGRIDRHEFARRVAAATGLSVADVQAASDRWLRGPYPGTADLLADLSRARVRSACLSNTNENHWEWITQPDGPNALPLHLLHHRFASHLIGCAKPDAAIYRHVEETTGVPAGRILFFDDDPDNIAAAHNRGWQTELIAPCDDPPAQVRAHLRRRAMLPAG